MRKTGSICKLFLHLSRACLGKMIVFNTLNSKVVGQNRVVVFLAYDAVVVDDCIQPVGDREDGALLESHPHHLLSTMATTHAITTCISSLICCGACSPEPVLVKTSRFPGAFSCVSVFRLCLCSASGREGFSFERALTWIFWSVWTSTEAVHSSIISSCSHTRTRGSHHQRCSETDTCKIPGQRTTRVDLQRVYSSTAMASHGGR